MMRASNPSAEITALNALAFLAQSQDVIDRFVQTSGIDPADLRHRAGDADVLAAVLDYLLADDTLLTAFCEAHSLGPRDVHLARRAVGGE